VPAVWNHLTFKLNDPHDSAIYNQIRLAGRNAFCFAADRTDEDRSSVLETKDIDDLQFNQHCRVHATILSFSGAAAVAVQLVCRADSMHVTVQVGDLAKQGTPFAAEFLVDIGSIDCLVARDHLSAAGVQPEGKAVYELANGQPVEYEYGFGRTAFLGEETVAQIIFGTPDAEPILGVVALENTGLVVDPVTKNLKRLHAKPLK